MESISSGHHSASAPDPGLSCPAPSAVTAFRHFCLRVSAQCVPGSSLLSLPLWIPGQSLPGDAAGRLPEGVTNPTPLSPTDLCCHWFLICCPCGPYLAMVWWLVCLNYPETSASWSILSFWWCHPCWKGQRVKARLIWTISPRV